VRLFAVFYTSVAKGAIQLGDEVFFNSHKKSRNACERYGFLIYGLTL
jgi:hypothetical protein